jgi:hypothetical protein
MTKPAVDPQFSGVMAVAEEDRLIRRESDAAPIR